MDIARMNVRIEICRFTVSTDEIGNHEDAWNQYHSCYATVSGESGKEASSSGREEDISQISFTIRYCDAASVINSTDYCVFFEGARYDILAVDHMNYRRKCIRLICKKDSTGEKEDEVNE